MTQQQKWYIVNVTPGQENKTSLEIKALLQKGVLQDNISEIVVPTKSVARVRRGQKVLEAQKIFPGYIFILADLSKFVYDTIVNLPKVIGILGAKNNPKPVTDHEMLEILKYNTNQENAIEDHKHLQFQIGETVKIIQGSFDSFSGIVEEFDQEKQKLKISVSIFGRSTMVDLSIDQVEKIEN
jgi:transcriptional antiterminator NusG